MVNFASFLLFILLFVSCSHQEKPTTNVSGVDPALEQIVQRLLLGKLPPADTLQQFYEIVDRYQTSDSLSRSRTAFIKANYFAQRGSYHLAKAAYINSINYAARGDSLRAILYNRLGTVNRHLGDYSNAIFNYRNSIAIAETKNDTLVAAGNYASMAQMNFEKGNIERSRENIEKVFALLGRYRFTKPNLIALHTLTNIEGSTGNYRDAMQIDSLAIKMCNENNAWENAVPFQDNLARCFMQYLHNYPAAKQLFMKNLAVDRQLNNQSWIADTYLNLAELNAFEKRFDSTEIYLQKAKKIFDSTGQLNNHLKYYQVVETISSMENDLSKMYKAKSDYIRTYKKYINEKNEALSEEYNVLFETEEKEKQLTKARLLLAEKQRESDKKTFWLIALILVITGGIIAFRNYKLRGKLQKEIHDSEKRQLEEQRTYDLQNQRLEISRDLHDNIGAQLSFVSSILGSAIKSGSYELHPDKLFKVDALTKEAIMELRNTLWVLQSAAPNVEALKDKMLHFIHSAAEAKAEIRFQFDHIILYNSALTAKTALHLFRIFQEIINNAIKHSNATEISVRLDADTAEMVLSVEDNGMGFDTQKTATDSYGLTNIKMRAADIGELEFSSTTSGTTYIIKIKMHGENCNSG